VPNWLTLPTPDPAGDGTGLWSCTTSSGRPGGQLIAWFDDRFRIGAEVLVKLNESGIPRAKWVAVVEAGIGAISAECTR
jgi:hypothetical protein